MHAFVFCFLVLCSLSIASFGKGTKSLSGFSVDLIHRDSPLSPYYNPSLTQSERIKNAALRSIARSKRLGLSQNENENPKTITTPDQGNGEYLMRFYIGTPPVERFAIADTGSDLIWVQCSPCEKCSPQNTPLFDPRKSSTFRSVSCDSQPCTLLPLTWHRCTKSGISIGKKKVAVSKSETDGSMFIDSGTTFTMLQQSLYNKFVTLVNEVYGSEVEKNPPKGYDICIGTDANVLDIVFHFTGAKIRLKPINMLTLVNGNLYCMLVQSTSAHGFNVLGNQAQTNFQVEYDLHLGKISFAPADCAKH